MNLRNTLILVFGLAVVFMASCKKSSSSDPVVEVTGITLSETTLEIEVESTATLTATIEPEDAEGDVTWSSSDPSVVAVNEGIVTALKEGTAKVAVSVGAFSATCDVTVKAKGLGELPESLKGSDYYIIQLDEISVAAIQDKITYDFRPDDENKNLWIWENTFAAGSPSGLNAYGLAQGWISFEVGQAGWSGAGFNVGPNFGEIDMTNLYENPDDYVFHISLKSAQEGTSYLFIFTDGTAEAKVVLGAAAMEEIEPFQDFTRDNEWHEIEIPVSKLRELGVFFNSPFSDVNVLAVLAGGVAGTTLDMDAAFFYKKAE